MDYKELAKELLQSLYLFHRTAVQQKVNESLRGEWFMLQYIAGQEDDVIPSEISRDMDISTARIAAALNSMESKGLITRQTDKNDRRRVFVKLTPTGRDLAENHRESVLRDTEKMLCLLGGHDAGEYVRIVGRLAKIAPLYAGPQPEEIP